MTFGDHDFAEVLTWTAVDVGLRVSFTSPSLDIWELPVACMGWDHMRDVIRHIGEIEQQAGPLAGYLEC